MAVQQGFVRAGAHAEAEVGAAFVHRGTHRFGRPFDQRELHLRMLLAELGDGAGQQRHAGRGQRRDRQVAAAAFEELRQLAERAVEVLQDAQRDRQQLAPRRRELDVPRVAVEQARAHQVFDDAHRAAQRRLRHVQRLRGGAEVGGLRDFDEGLELLQRDVDSHGRGFPGVAVD
ncbi:hypothetical protein D3C72_1334130 [compost metagenome]